MMCVLCIVLTFPNSYEVLKDDGKRKAFDNGGFSGMGDSDSGSGFASGGFYGSGFESMGGNEALNNFWNQAFGGNHFSGFNSGRQQPFVEVQVCACLLSLRSLLPAIHSV
jgi:DnaJ-class molecular chaperone